MSEDGYLTCVISGSFKFKPEIDEKRLELEDHDFKVLGPDAGWLYLPYPRGLITASRNYGIRPLPSERSMPVLRIEPEFIKLLRRSDFVYLVNPHGYVGISASFEMGVAWGGGVPIFASNPIDFSTWEFDDIRFYQEVRDSISVGVPMDEIAGTVLERKLRDIRGRAIQLGERMASMGHDVEPFQGRSLST